MTLIDTMCELTAVALVDALASKLAEVEAKTLIGTLVNVKSEAVIQALADK